MSMSLDVETTRRLRGETPAAFHAGAQELGNGQPEGNQHAVV